MSNVNPRIPGGRATFGMRERPAAAARALRRECGRLRRRLAQCDESTMVGAAVAHAIRDRLTQLLQRCGGSTVREGARLQAYGVAVVALTGALREIPRGQQAPSRVAGTPDQMLAGSPVVLEALEHQDVFTATIARRVFEAHCSRAG
jgi:hypothetical protein